MGDAQNLGQQYLNTMGDITGFNQITRAGGDVFGEITGKKAAERSIEAQTNAANRASDVQKYIYDQTRQDLEPWRQTGMRSLGGLENQDFQRDFTMNDYQQDPGYQFRLNEGNKAINAAAAARGLGNSGATMKALAKYGQNVASEEYNNAYNRFNADRDRRFNRLASLAGVGQTATNQMGQAGMNYGNNVSNIQMGLGNSIAGANMGQWQTMMGLAGQGAMAGATLAACDQRLKTNIKPVPKEDLDEMKKHLKAYSFNYINDVDGKGDWVGIMAQDLEKSKLGKTLLVEDGRGMKLIDIKKLLILFLATMAEA